MYQYEIIYVSTFRFIKHEILRLPSGLATHNHPDKHIIIEQIDQVIKNRRIVGRKIIQSMFSEKELLRRATNLSSYRRYNLSYNCEDYISELLGNSPTSEQRNFWVMLGLIGLGLLASR